MAYGLLGVIAGWALKRTADEVAQALPTPGGGYPYPPPASRGVPFAGGSAPYWPIQASNNRRHGQVGYKDVNGKWHGNMARAFRASRGSRHHAGIDIYANPNDVVVAPEDGVVVGRQTFYAGTGAMLIETDSGIVVLLGETKMGGAGEFGVDIGTRVKAGQPVTRIGRSNSGSHMLHFETYTGGTRKNSPWYKSGGPPPNLLDPTDYLLRAKARMETVA